MTRVAATPLVAASVVINNGRSGWLKSEIPAGGVLDNDSLADGVEYLAVLESAPFVASLEWHWDGTFVLSGVDATYSFSYGRYANGVYAGSESVTATIGAGGPPPIFGISVGNGSSFVPATVYVGNGSGFVPASLYVGNGSAFVMP